MKLEFDPSIRLSKENKRMLSIINDILREYRREGYKLTLRQLYYQLVSRALIHENSLAQYSKLSGLLTRGRMAGNVDWNIIEDRNRIPYLPYYNEDVADAFSDTKEHYRLDRQRDQEINVELWVEKDALSGVLRRMTSKYHVHLVVNKGYTSTTAMYDAFQRIKDSIKKGRKVHILYLGDHDPSGLDMDRDIRDRMKLFVTNSKEMQMMYWDLETEEQDDFRESDFFYGFVQKFGDKDKQLMTKNDNPDYDGIYFNMPYIYMQKQFHDLFTVERIALTQEQIKTYNPPTNPAKFKDPRSEWYVKHFGRVSWEVDALKPEVLDEIVTEKIEGLIDMSKYEKMLKQEKNDREEIQGIITDLNLTDNDK
jgi:hypothetical protein